jgi:hypothetical protein
MTLQPFYVVFLVFVGIFLLVLAYGLFSVSRWTHTREKVPESPRGKAGNSGVCPICQSFLTNGAQVKSALFPGGSDRICHIFGCTHCHPYLEDKVVRTCPVCKKTLPQEGYLIARMFERPGQKPHVHILGCTGCRLSRSR